jgi:GTP-binding protein HflX
VLNKADRLDEAQRAALRAEFPDALLLSARSPADVAALHAELVRFFEQDMEEASFAVPFSSQRHVALLHERTRVLEETYDEEGAKLRVRARPAVLRSLAREMGANFTTSEASGD